MKTHCHLCHHPKNDETDLFTGRCVLVNGPVIIGAGPSGLAIAAGLQQQGVPFVILERSNSIASLWQNRTYDRLKLHLPKKFSQLPYFPFPDKYPSYPSKHQFTQYLKSYAKQFSIRPHFNEPVGSAELDKRCAMWRVKTTSGETEYLCRWLVVATGENAEEVLPEFEGLPDFIGSVIHACDYKSGEAYRGKRVLVVGCGNSGMEVSLDLSLHDAIPTMVVRSSVHVLPREMLGISTFELGASLAKWMPIRAVDRMLVLASRLILGDVEKYGLKRPRSGPLQLKNEQGKTPVLDVGTLSKIKSGRVKVVPGIKRFLPGGVELVDGRILEIDSVILATGYSSNVPSWLKESEFFSGDGFPRAPFPNGWKGQNGLYAVGFTRRGLPGASLDAVRVAQDIGRIWSAETRQKPHFVGFSCNRKCNVNKK